jgi:hypothetical protein
VEAWAARIDTDKSTWKRLMDALTEKKHTILDTVMVLQVMHAVAKKALLLRNTISVLMQDSTVANSVIEFIKDNPQMFDGVSVDVDEPTAAAAEVKESPTTKEEIKDEATATRGK